MRMYLAARYGRRAELCGYAAALCERGHQVTSRWLDGHHDAVTLEGRADKEAVRAAWAQEDLDDVKAADVLVAFTEEPYSQNGRGGHMVELGVALALRRRVIIVGPRENVFCCLPQIERYDTLAQALEESKLLGGARGGHKRPTFKNIDRRLLANRGRPTSMDAILALGSTVNLQELIYWYLITCGDHTDDEIKDYFDQTIRTNGRPKYDPRGYVARRIELMHQGLVVDSGEKRKTHSGNEAIVWAAVPVWEEDTPPARPVKPHPGTAPREPQPRTDQDDEPGGYQQLSFV